MKYEPIFRTVQQALWVSYAVEVAHPSPKSPLRVLQEMAADGYLPEQVKTSGIDFGELKPLEQRAECASVRGYAERLLEGMELDVVLAKYSMVKEVKMGSIEKVVEHIMPSMTRQGKRVAKELCGKAFLSKYKPDNHYSSYAIAGRVGGIHHDTVNEAYEAALNIIMVAEQNAVLTLRKTFVPGISAR